MGGGRWDRGWGIGYRVRGKGKAGRLEGGRCKVELLR